MTWEKSVFRGRKVKIGSERIFVSCLLEGVVSNGEETKQDMTQYLTAILMSLTSVRDFLVCLTNAIL